MSVMGNDNLVTTTRESDINSVVSHIVKFGNVWEVVSNTDGNGKRNVLFFFGSTNFLDKREPVFFHTGERIVIADHEVGVGLDTTDENAELTAVIVDDGTDLFRHLVGVR